MAAFKPRSAAETAEVVAWAAAGRQTLELRSGGSKQRLGRPSATDHTLDLSAQAGIVDYDPAELVLTVRAATPMRDIADALASAGQVLAFEPPDWTELLGGIGTPTLGGVIACNLSGPRRVRAGAARDHLLGFSAINGWGEIWKAGGKVVKNVTGYDMCKLQAGAYGTLSALIELSVRVLPRPETECSVVLVGQSDEDAIRLLATALNSPHEVSAAAHLPASAAMRSSVAAVASAVAVTVLRLEGHHPSVQFRASALEAELGAAYRLSADASAALWREVASAALLLGVADTVVWRVCPTPSSATAIFCAAKAAFASLRGFYDWGGGLLWLAMDEAEAGEDVGDAVIRKAVAICGGHATLVRAPAAVRGRVAVFEPVPAALAGLTQRVKRGFDPHAVFNPGRMYEGV